MEGAARLVSEREQMRRVHRFAAKAVHPTKEMRDVCRKALVRRDPLGPLRAGLGCLDQTQPVALVALEEDIQRDAMIVGQLCRGGLRAGGEPLLERGAELFDDGSQANGVLVARRRGPLGVPDGRARDEDVAQRAAFQIEALREERIAVHQPGDRSHHIALAIANKCHASRPSCRV